MKTSLTGSIPESFCTSWGDWVKWKDVEEIFEEIGTLSFIFFNMFLSLTPFIALLIFLVYSGLLVSFMEFVCKAYGRLLTVFVLLSFVYFILVISRKLPLAFEVSDEEYERFCKILERFKKRLKRRTEERFEKVRK